MGDVIPFCSKRMQWTKANNALDDAFFFNRGIGPVEKAKAIRNYFASDDADAPFPIVHLANRLGIKVYKDDLSGIKSIPNLKGYLALKPDDAPVIVVSKHESIGHQRWTVAHEIWHYLDEGDREIDDMVFFTEVGDYDNNSDEAENNATMFAAELLMPAKEFKRLWNSFERSEVDDAMIYLRDRFGVSLTAVQRRASSLKLA